MKRKEQVGSVARKKIENELLSGNKGKEERKWKGVRSREEEGERE